MNGNPAKSKSEAPAEKPHASRWNFKYPRQKQSRIKNKKSGTGKKKDVDARRGI